MIWTDVNDLNEIEKEIETEVQFKVKVCTLCTWVLYLMQAIAFHQCLIGAKARRIILAFQCLLCLMLKTLGCFQNMKTEKFTFLR